MGCNFVSHQVISLRRLCSPSPLSYNNIPGHLYITSCGTHPVKTLYLQIGDSPTKKSGRVFNLSFFGRWSSGMRGFIGARFIEFSHSIEQHVILQVKWKQEDCQNWCCKVFTWQQQYVTFPLVGSWKLMEASQIDTSIMHVYIRARWHLCVFWWICACLLIYAFRFTHACL